MHLHELISSEMAGELIASAEREGSDVAVAFTALESIARLTKNLDAAASIVADVAAMDRDQRAVVAEAAGRMLTSALVSVQITARVVPSVRPLLASVVEAAQAIITACNTPLESHV